MLTVVVKCDFCGAVFAKKRSELHTHNFCCIQHFRSWNSNRMSEYNKSTNPKNKPDRVTDLDIRCIAEKMLAGSMPVNEGFSASLKARLARSEHCRVRKPGIGKTYRKFLGRHEHRVIAEIVLGRKLRSNEIVHHIDGNKLNNRPENLHVMDRASHVKLHMQMMKAQLGGDVHE